MTVRQCRRLILSSLSPRHAPPCAGQVLAEARAPCPTQEGPSFVAAREVRQRPGLGDGAGGGLKAAGGPA